MIVEALLMRTAAFGNFPPLRPDASPNFQQSNPLIRGGDSLLMFHLGGEPRSGFAPDAETPLCIYPLSQAHTTSGDYVLHIMNCAHSLLSGENSSRIFTLNSDLSKRSDLFSHPALSLHRTATTNMAIPESILVNLEHNGIFSKLVKALEGNTPLAFAALAFVYLFQIIYYLSFHPLHKAPGPLLARFRGLWRNIRYFRSTWHDDILGLHRKYGPVVRMVPNEVSFVNRKALANVIWPWDSIEEGEWLYISSRKIFAKRFNRHHRTAPGLSLTCNKGIFVPLNEVQGVLILANMPSFFASQDVMLHRALRARVSAAYSMSSILAIEPFSQEVADKTWSKFRSFAKTNQAIDLDE